MTEEFRTDRTYIVDLNILNSYNARGCEACNQKFNLGDTVVLAVGGWEGGTRLIHESDAVFDKETRTYYERSYYHSRSS